MAETPRNQEGQKPTRTPDETQRRLEEKKTAQRGKANKSRTDERIGQARSS